MPRQWFQINHNYLRILPCWSLTTPFHSRLPSRCSWKRGFKRNKDVKIREEWKTNLMSLAILFHFLCAQHVSDINISIIRSLRLCCWITTSVVLFSVRCVLEIWCGWFWVVFVLQAEACNTNTTENKTTDVVIQQHSRKLLMMDILMSETCWAHKKWNTIASDIKLVFLSSTIKICLEGYTSLSPTNCRIGFVVRACGWLKMAVIVNRDM